MNLINQKIKRKEPNRKGETALMDRSQQRELLGPRRGNRWLGALQSLPTEVVPIDLLHGLNAPQELETGVVGIEVRVGQHVLGSDEEIFDRDLVVTEMNRVAHRTESERLDLQSGRPRSHSKD